MDTKKNSFSLIDFHFIASHRVLNTKYDYFGDLQLSMWRCTDELRIRANVLHRSTRKDAKHYIGISNNFCNIVEFFCYRLNSH